MNDLEAPAVSTHAANSPDYYPAPRQKAPVDEERAEDAYDIPLGSVVHAGDTGRAWVFVGWERNSAGLYPFFVEAKDPERPPHEPVYDYHAVFAPTLERKFPDISRFRPQP